MIRDTMYIDPDTITRMIYGMNDLLNGLNHADFITGINDALKDSAKRHDFMERDYNILLGSVQFMSGAVEIIADGLMNGDIEIAMTPTYQGKEFDEWRRGSHEMIDQITDQKHMESVFHFVKGLKG